MNYFYYLIPLLFSYSCNNGVHKDPAAVPVRQTDTNITIAVAAATFADNSLYSYNATSAEKFGDTLYALEIDHYLKKYSGDGTTTGEVESYYRASQKLDTLIESVYQEIYQRLPYEQDKKLFKTAQDNWKNYYTSETKFLHDIYYTQKAEYGFGREHAITQAQWAFQVARQRLILLKNINEQIYSDRE